MQTGIIYQAYNKISGKSYIGQTKRVLEQRIKEHYLDSKRYDHNFPRALLKYNKEDWNWITLIETETIKLNDYEDYYIDLFNSYNNGYNSRKNNQILCYLTDKKTLNNKPKYKLYHPEYGVIEETLCDLCKRYIGFSSAILQLVEGKIHHIKGYVLATNKDKYNELLNVHEFYNPKYGTIKCTCTELDEQYLKLYLRNDKRANALGRKRIKMYHGWVLDTNKHLYYKINDRNKNIPAGLITLNHNIFGTMTLRMFEFYELYNLLIADIHRLKRKEVNEIDGWKLVS